MFCTAHAFSFVNSEKYNGIGHGMLCSIIRICMDRENVRDILCEFKVGIWLLLNINFHYLFKKLAYQKTFHLLPTFVSDLCSFVS